MSQLATPPMFGGFSQAPPQGIITDENGQPLPPGGKVPKLPPPKGPPMPSMPGAGPPTTNPGPPMVAAPDSNPARGDFLASAAPPEGPLSPPPGAASGASAAPPPMPGSPSAAVGPASLADLMPAAKEAGRIGSTPLPPSPLEQFLASEPATVHELRGTQRSTEFLGPGAAGRPQYGGPGFLEAGDEAAKMAFGRNAQAQQLGQAAQLAMLHQYPQLYQTQGLIAQHQAEMAFKQSPAYLRNIAKAEAIAKNPGMTPEQLIALDQSLNYAYPTGAPPGTPGATPVDDATAAMARLDPRLTGMSTTVDAAGKTTPVDPSGWFRALSEQHDDAWIQQNAPTILKFMEQKFGGLDVLRQSAGPGIISNLLNWSIPGGYGGRWGQGTPLSEQFGNLTSTQTPQLSKSNAMLRALLRYQAGQPWAPPAYRTGKPAAPPPPMPR